MDFKYDTYTRKIFLMFSDGKEYLITKDVEEKIQQLLNDIEGD